MPKPAARNEEALYEIRVRGLLDESWSDWLDGLAITPSDDGNSVLTGPIREKVVILALFLVALCSVRFVDWNTRKPFLRALDRVTAGITEAQADEIMDGYMKGISPMAQVDEQGGIDWGTVSYRHTTEAWGNVDVGVLAFQNGRVVRVDFLPD